MTTNKTTAPTTNKPRVSYRFTNSSDVLALLTYRGAQAFYAETLDEFVHAFDGTDFEIVSATAQLKTSNRGTSYQLVIIPAHIKTKGIYISTNTTAALDYRKIAAAYVKTWNRYHEREIEAAKPENVAARELAQRTSKIRRSARAYERNLVKHGMAAEKAARYAAEYLAAEMAKIEGANN